MKINVMEQDLNYAIEKVKKVLLGKSKEIALNNVVLTAKNNRITLTATNFISTIEVDIPGNVEIEGQAIIDKENFKAIKKLKSNMTITSDLNEVSIEANRNFSFLQIDTEEFPIEAYDIGYSKDNTNEVFTIKADKFKNCLKLKTFASAEEYKPSFNSITINGNYTQSLDGYRGARFELGVDNKFDKHIIIPLDSVNELDKIIENKNAELLEFRCTVQSDIPKFLMIYGRDWTYKTRLYEGDIFNMEGVIPKEFEQSITVDYKKLKDAVEFATEIKSEKIPVIFAITNNSLEVKKTTQTKKMKEKIECVTVNNTEMVQGFNEKYILDVLKTIGNTDNILIKQTGGLSPIIIENPKVENETYIVLPVRINDEEAAA